MNIYGIVCRFFSDFIDSLCWVGWDLRVSRLIFFIGVIVVNYDVNFLVFMSEKKCFCEVVFMVVVILV